MSLRINGSVLGKRNVPTLSLATGMWNMRAQALYKRDNLWPLAYDPDAAAYIAAVEAADGEALEPAIGLAYDRFIRGCKSDEIWDAIKASCILAGARTLDGALVPLVGTAPTNNNFVSGDYNRETGLIGNASTKYLNSNRNNNADPQNSNHLAAYATSIGAGAAKTVLASNSFFDNGSNVILSSSATNVFTRSRSVIGTSIAAISTGGLIGINRSNSGNYNVRVNGSNFTVTTMSQLPFNGDILAYRRGILSPEYSDHRLSFYSIGESLDLAALDARVTTLTADITAALP
jgi:hypothetical protein